MTSHVFSLKGAKVKDYKFTFNAENIDITLSIGVISISEELETLEDILASANLALISAQEMAFLGFSTLCRGIKMFFSGFEPTSASRVAPGPGTF